MGATVLVGDHLLLLVLLGKEPAALRPDGARIATTGLWYHRLCRALSDSSVIGPMSRRLGGLTTSAAAEVVATVVRLPPSIELVSLRDLGWEMAQLLTSGLRLNLLSLEAVAAARHLEAAICLASTDRNQPLVEAAQNIQLPFRFVSITEGGNVR